MANTKKNTTNKKPGRFKQYKETRKTKKLEKNKKKEEKKQEKEKKKQEKEKKKQEKIKAKTNKINKKDKDFLGVTILSPNIISSLGPSEAAAGFLTFCFFSNLPFLSFSYFFSKSVFTLSNNFL